MLSRKHLPKWLRGSAATRKRKSTPKPQATEAESLEVRRLMAADLFVSNAGDDWADGSLDHPFQTIRRALDAANPGDTITLRNGVYEGGVNIDIDNLTIRSMPGEWAVIESSLDEYTDGHSNSVIRYNYDVQGGKLENLEITGGYYYGVMFWDWWDSNFDAGSIHVGASGITLDGVKVHDTGVDAVKITPGADDITIINSEIYNTGLRSSTSSDGIDNNNGDRMVVRNNYLHDIDGIGILTSGGTKDTLVEQNYVKDTCGAGIVNGFYSELEWLDPNENPQYYASINTVVRNNIVVNAQQAGIGIYGALNAQVTNNTFINPASEAQAPIQFGGYDMWVSNTAPSYQHITSVNPTVTNNVVITNSDNLTRMVDIRQDSITGPLTLDYNLYYGTSTRGVLFIDRNLTGDGTPEQSFSQWKQNYGYDQHSLVANPMLSPDGHLLAGSPAINAGLNFAGVTSDIDGNTRSDGINDLGADEFLAGNNLVFPPAPFGAPSIEVAEKGYHDDENKTITVRVVRHGTTSDTVTVDFATVDGSAQSGTDYVATQGTLIFAPGETEKFVTIQLLVDGEPEGDEHFRFQLSHVTTDGTYPVRLGHISQASVTIDDLETPITLNYATKWVSNDGSDVQGDGTEAHPWKSLQFAADNVGPGDYVIVKPGNYWGFQVTNDGKADARITFHAMEGVNIDAPNPENNLDGINLEGADYVTIEGFHVADMPRAGLRSVNNQGAIFRENVSDHNGYWGFLSGWSYNLTVENNTMSNSQHEHGIYISNSSDDAVVRNNTVFGNRCSGIQFNADRYLEGDGIHSRNLVEGNVIYDNGVGGGAAINLDGFQDGIVRNNVLYNNHSTGIVLYVGFAADGSKNNLVENNTVVMAEDSRWALLMTDGSDGNTVVNNILVTKNPNTGSMTVEANSLPSRSDYNIVEDLFQTDGANGNFAAWQNFSGGQDAHSQVLSPGALANFLSTVFVDPANHNFQLQAGNSAIDAGDASQAPAYDLYQHARPSGAGVDIGALEYGSFSPQLHFEWANVIGYESIGMAEITVTRTGDTSGMTAGFVAITDGTAQAGSDYHAASGWIVFQPGETHKTFRVFVNDDTLIENRETVNLKLYQVGDPTGLLPTDQVGDPTGLIPTDQLGLFAETIPTDQATMHIVSDDAWLPGAIQFESPLVTVDEAAGTVSITVVRGGGSSGEVSVHYSTGLFTPPKQATWIKRHTDLLYPTDRDIPATAGADYQITDGTLVFAEGETSKTITIPIVNDDWYEQGEAFLVTLDNPTSGATLGKNASVKVHIDSEDLKLPGTFNFSSTSHTVTEGQPSVTVTIVRQNGGNVEAGVRLYDTGAGNGSTTDSAWAPSDYGWLPEMVTFAPGEMSKTITIPIVDDTSTEKDEVFSIQLYSPMNDAQVGAINKTYVTIKDNESTFYFSNPQGGWSFSGSEATKQVPVTVVRQGSTVTPASVTVSTSDWGSAISGVDFTAINQTLNFGVGEVSKTIFVPVIDDTLFEQTETFPVNMSNAVGAEQGSWSWSASIIDNDAVASPGKLQLSAATYSVSEAGGMAKITVTRVGGSDGTVTVKYATSDGASGYSGLTAWAGADYSSTNGTLTFAPGETSKVISVPITNDSSIEKNEVFTITLSNPAGGATLGSITKAVVTIVEDDSAIQFGTSNYVVNESAGYVTITLVRQGSTAGTATVDLNISSGTAEAGKDFVMPASPKVTFADGESTKTVQLQIIDDAFKESTEWLYLSLSNASGASLGSSLYGNVKITDND